MNTTMRKTIITYTQNTHTDTHRHRHKYALYRDTAAIEIGSNETRR